MLDLAPGPEDTVRMVVSHRRPEDRDDRPTQWAPPTEVSIALIVVGGLIVLAVVCALCALGVAKELL